MTFVLSRDLAGVDTARLASLLCREQGMLFERFDLHTRARVRCVIAWRWHDVEGPSFEVALRDALADAPDGALHLAFTGGNAGQPRNLSDESFPSWFVRRLQAWVELDFTTGSVRHVADPADPADALNEATFEEWLASTRQVSAHSPPEPSPRAASSAAGWAADLDAEGYAQRLRGLQQRITVGDIEGAVLSIGLSRPTSAHPLDLYGEMARTNPSTFGYCFHGNGVALAGSSPLAFLDYEHGQVRLETDAGTRPVTGNRTVDEAARAALLASPKDAAEHSVVVNEETQSLSALTDGGAPDGGVRRVVDREVRAFSHVMHLYTVLAAQLRPGLDLPAALTAMFPPAAVSGRPRRAAWEAGCEVEVGPRGPYGGIAGLIRGSSSAQFAVVIRSLWIENGIARLRVGGKIVKDSTPEDEYAEALNKSRFLVDSVSRVEAAK